MPDDRYLIPPPARSWCRRISADRWFSIVAILASLAAAIFTGFYAWDTHGMRLDAQEAARKQSEDVKRARQAAEKSAVAAEKSAAAADKLADAMKESAKAAEQSARAGLQSLSLNKRALILSNIPTMEVFNARLLKPLSVGNVPTVTTKLYNASKGTAYSFEAQVWMNITPAFQFIYNSPRGPASITDVAPGPQHIFESTLNHRAPLTEEQLKLIQNGQLILYVYGRATYYDNTLERRRRYTWRWCSSYNPLEDGSDILLLGVCSEHNDTQIE
jgi:hypothetical protein